MNADDVYNLIEGKLSNWTESFIKLLPNILLAAIILVIGFFLAKGIRKFAHKLIGKVSDNKTLNSLFASVIYIFGLGIVLFIVLSVLQLDKAVTSILAGAGILGLALAFQDIAANFMSGILISFRRPIHIGDLIKVGDIMGQVKSINLRDTVLVAFNGQTML